MRPWINGRTLLEEIDPAALLLAEERDLVEVLVGEFGKIAILKRESVGALVIEEGEFAWELLRSRGRLEALSRTGLLDSPPEASFDRLTRLAASIVKCPISLISIVSAERQYFKSAFGISEDAIPDRGTPLCDSICKFVALTAEPMVVHDTLEHPLTKGIPFVRDMNLRAYAGYPLWSLDKHALSAFCLIDNVPRHWTDDELNLLKEFAGMANVCIEAVEMRQHLLTDFFERS